MKKLNFNARDPGGVFKNRRSKENLNQLKPNGSESREFFFMHNPYSTSLMSPVS
jgi:hypothetical protein